MTVGDFVLVNTYMLQVMQPVEQLGRAVQGLAEGTAMLDKMLELFRQGTEHTSPPSQKSAPWRGRLQFESVSVSYRAGRRILRDISFELPAGQTLGIVGSSGTGKSTVVRLLVRLIEPDDGRILLDGSPLAGMALHELRAAIAVVPQDTVLFNDSIAYNIGFGRAGSTQEQIERAAKLAHLHDFVLSLPEGYDTRVGERGVRLSGGERQRVSIARAALRQPRIFVFDEATSSLDSRTEREILENLQEISRQCTTLIVAHRLSTVVHADEIIVIVDGRVAERGTHAELLHLNGRYRALWDAQQTRAGAALA
jgi:ATP-binding cassette subfamily B protein